MNKISGSDWALILLIALVSSCSLAETWIASSRSIDCMKAGGKWHQPGRCRADYCEGSK